MRLIWLIPCAVLLLALQTTWAPRFTVAGARADWLLVVVVYLGLFAPKAEAVIASWVLGLAADLLTIERFGLFSLSYAAAAITVVSSREYLYRQQAATQFLVTLAMSAALRLAWFVYAGFLYGGGIGSPASFLREVLLGSLYTAIWAPPVHQLLLWLGRPTRGRGRRAGAIHV